MTAPEHIDRLQRLYEIRHAIQTYAAERNKLMVELRSEGATIDDLHRFTGIAPDTIRRTIRLAKGNRCDSHVGC